MLKRPKTTAPALIPNIVPVLIPEITLPVLNPDISVPVLIYKGLNRLFKRLIPISAVPKPKKAVLIFTRYFNKFADYYKIIVRVINNITVTLIE